MSTSIKDKIAALRAKTRANGCTEAEAMAAAALAAKLMGEHGLSEEDLVMTEGAAIERTVTPTWRNKLNATIAYCTNTAVVALRGRRSTGIMFVGRASDVEIALYLRDVCVRAVDGGLRAFKTQIGGMYRRRRSLATRRLAAADFTNGFVDRLCARLMEVFAPYRDDVARNAARNALAKQAPNAVAEPAPKREGRYSDADAAGWSAANDVALNRGVRGADPARLTRAEGARG